jgi:hypothetical protein
MSDNDTNKSQQSLDTAANKKEFSEPKLTFVEPRLVKHGDAIRITQQTGFFGTIDPDGYPV